MDRRILNKYRDKNILFVVGSTAEKPVSELYREGCIVAPAKDMDILRARIAEADLAYLYDVPADIRDELIPVCYAQDVPFLCHVDLSGAVMAGAKILSDYDSPVLYHRKSRIFGFRGTIKRTFDILLSLLALIVTSPVMAVIALVIRLQDGSPVIYRQTRCTRGGREFPIYKFRSMVASAEQQTGAVLSSEDDPRLTRAGRFLRNSKLDELPQLVNILRGDMSIVGPRPERPELIREALREVPEFMLRTRVRAGLTGYAQVQGNYNTDFRRKLYWDLLYIERFSLWLDVKIILMTIPAILKKRNRETTDEREPVDV